MAVGGRIEINIDYNAFLSQLNAAVSRVQRGTKKATIEACEEIKQESLAEVPEATGTLASSFYYEVEGSYTNFTAEIGYGKGDPVNPQTGKRVSEYMIEVHEDLEAPHPKGKAKFLEDPLRNYQKQARSKMASTIRNELG